LKRSPKHRDCSSEFYTQGTQKISTPSRESFEKQQNIEDNNVESSLNCLMSNSPKIKKLIKDLKNKNISRSKKKDNQPELDATQQMLLKALNENLKKSLQEKKVVNIRNSYKFVLGNPQPVAKPSKKIENFKNVYKQQPNLVQPLRNKLKSDIFLLN